MWTELELSCLSSPESQWRRHLPEFQKTRPVTAGPGFLILITAVAALGGLLFGYDTAVISGAIDLLQVHFHLAATATGWAASSALVGCMIGAVLTARACDLYGRRNILLFAAACFFLSSLGSAAATSFTVFTLFRIVGGIGIGTASVASPLYISESAPARWRGGLVTINQLAIVVGMLLIYFVNYSIRRSGTLEWNRSWGWRWMFASGVLPSVLLAVMLWMVPETARYLLMKGHTREAEDVAARTGSDVLCEILSAEDRGQWPVQATRRMYVVGILLAVFQQITGINVFLYYAPVIFARLGHSHDAALLQTICIGAINLIFTVVAMVFVDRAGRKPLLVGGCIGMAACLAAMGVATFHGNGSGWLFLYVLGYVVCFALSVGPVTWILLSELFPTSHRAKVLAVSSAALWTANFLVSQTFPMLDENAYLIHHFGHSAPFFLYSIFCIMEVWFVSVVLPETKNRRLEEIEKMWSKPRGIARMKSRAS